MTEEKNKRKVLYIVEDKNTAQFRYRVQNVMEAARESAKYEVDFALKNDLSKVDLGKIDLVVILRQTAKDRAVLDFIKKAKGRGIKILFDLDDLIFDCLDLPILMKATNSKNILYWASYMWGIRRIAKKVDGFITTNDFLGKMLTRSFNKPYAVIPNSLNEAQVTVAEKLLAEKTHDGFIVGYFSGSPTHAKDFQMIETQLMHFLSAHEDAKFLMVGYMNPSKEMLKLVERGKVKILKLTNYLRLMELMAGVDVNLAPLVMNDFTNSKSELKFFEAGVVETVTVASPAFAFKNAIDDGRDGILAGPDEWFEKLEDLYKNPEKRAKMAKAARKYALDNYYGKKFLKEVEGAYEFFG